LYVSGRLPIGDVSPSIQSVIDRLSEAAWTPPFVEVREVPPSRVKRAKKR
jgi:hypothetical protein